MYPKASTNSGRNNVNLIKDSRVTAMLVGKAVPLHAMEALGREEV
jgi:hypothetical protein